MENKELLEKVARLGYPLVEVEKELDVNQTLLEVFKSRETRLLEGFPVLLVNAAKHDDFNYAKINSLLVSYVDVKYFKEFMLMSMALYDYFNLGYHWVNKFLEGLNEVEKEKLNLYKERMADNSQFMVDDYKFSPQRLKDMFELYFEQEVKENKKRRDKYVELSFEYALAQLFSPKQKELFLKKVNGETLTKTEKEYFSRAVKKKVLALANPDLNRFANMLLNA
ncbi:MAG: hypothetical protein A2Y03_00655 [Omnitrophica WOR_2 bacterium GWF2_38_59]|nr:MAG: hypothetical protein A2Y03_00655 [Omnitrophica WOR_2 bacterium GWF2_38_59]OGX49546.1 MAG: hypothetical protein A2243_10550 [Omnitrophica WOR_2 bacterium RIFOXYA2_FULL_38_17]OGX51311.1 MAG: hypothetical protein A2267_05895 [Omnitrophica WOR_2 bacterium RIFOXYA12_FULL_38_10]OGX58742.1 MAG: hypothetical protein A2306_12175 [Omnitrophica WOR_2 bacterium RIFOXYB2_FULL_38_16]